MPPPRRRSSRLRGSSATPGKSYNHASTRLESLAERDETPRSSPPSNLDAVPSSPLAPRTPATAGRIKPALAEMHPSKVQQSTTQQPDSGLRLGFTDIEARGNSNQPSGLTQQTPSKIGISSPSFDFRFARPAPQLGPEAQRMMDELREEALRIKVKLAAEREEEKRKDEESGEAGGRKIAQPKGKVGRFSDVHMAEFKKMDSIAGHPSPSKPNLTGTPRGLTKSATTNNLSSVPTPKSQSFLQSPGKLDRVKSMFGYPSLSANKPATKPAVDPAVVLAVKPTAIPSLSRSPSRPNLEKSLPSIPATPGAAGGSRTIKHVNFTPDAMSKTNAASQNSPSPIKSGIPRSASKISLSSRSTVRPAGRAKVEGMEVEYHSIAGVSSLDDSSKQVVYPSLPGARPLPTPPHKAPPTSSVPGSFTFRSDHTINFGASPKGFGSSPGQSSVRQVRQSVLPNTMPGSFPPGNKENKAPLPSVPHGMANKKRRRVESDDEAEDEERSPKKHKAVVAEGHMLVAPNLHATSTPTIPSPVKKRGVLSLSRLNMLSRPKNRK
ncbi:hypothetical protein BUE80_DR000352 [Diplocarpon rosae]|nr:hypothetical protein BUE80_DR000352 [Diplocarpon rosae]